MHILITAPHACSIENAAHVCDILANTCAMSLRTYLEAQGHQVSSIVNPSTTRDRLDVNRVEGRDHPYRRAIDQLLPLVDLLIDVHSFPPNEPRFRGHDIVVFNMPSAFDDHFVKALAMSLHNYGIKTLLYDGSPENDTVAAALEHGKMAVLLEFNEASTFRGGAIAMSILLAAREALT